MRGIEMLAKIFGWKDKEVKSDPPVGDRASRPPRFQVPAELRADHITYEPPKEYVLPSAKEDKPLE